LDDTKTFIETVEEADKIIPANPTANDIANIAQKGIPADGYINIPPSTGITWPVI
jgi:hypothetical protein